MCTGVFWTASWVRDATVRPSTRWACSCQSSTSFIIHLPWRDPNALRLRFGLREFPEIAYLVGCIFLAPLFFSLVVNELNEYWDVRTQGLATDAELTSFERAAS